MTSPTLLHHANFTAVRVERCGFVFIAHLARNYDQLPGFTKVEVYRSRTRNKHGIEWWVGYLDSTQIGRMHAALVRCVEIARESDLQTRLKRSRYHHQWYYYHWPSHTWRCPQTGVAQAEHEKNLAGLGYRETGRELESHNPIGQLGVSYAR